MLITGSVPFLASARDQEDVSDDLQDNNSVRVESRTNNGILDDSTNTLKFRKMDERDDSKEDEDKKRLSTSTERFDDDSKNKNDENDNDSDDEDIIEISRDSASKSSTTAGSPEGIKNRGQLRAFINHLVKEDDRIADVSISSTTIDARYAMPSKFLWSIPANINTNISVNTDGSVTIKYPWYAFLFSKDENKTTAKLEESIKSTIASGTSTTFSANVQARLLNILFSSLKNK
jgi:hypothetical protein